MNLEGPEVFAYGAILVIIALYVFKAITVKLLRLFIGVLYKSKNPALLWSTLAFGSDWDIGWTKDGSTLLLMQLFETRRIPRKEVAGYVRIDGYNVNEPPAITEVKYSGAPPATVTLMLTDEPEYRLHFGEPLAADHLCASMRESGIIQLHQGVLHTLET